MNILVTGAKGMVGTALVNNLKNIRDHKNRTRPEIKIDEIYEYDLQSSEEELDEYCKKADFVFHLAGVNRPENPEEFMQGNFGFSSKLVATLRKYENKATIMLSSSIQATLSGRFVDSEYGRSKKVFYQRCETLPHRFVIIVQPLQFLVCHKSEVNRRSIDGTERKRLEFQKLSEL